MGCEQVLGPAVSLVCRRRFFPQGQRSLASIEQRFPLFCIPQAPGARSDHFISLRRRALAPLAWLRAAGAARGRALRIALRSGSSLTPRRVSCRPVGVLVVPSPPRGRGERDEACAVFVPCRPVGAERVGVRGARLAGRTRCSLIVRGAPCFVGESDHRFRLGREARRRQTRHRRRTAAEKADVPERIALQRDRAPAVAPGLDRLAEGGRDVAQRRLQPVADAAQRRHPGVSRRVGLGVADDDRRRVGGGVSCDDPVQPVCIEAHGAALHVAPGPGPADVDPPVQRAHLALLCVWSR